MRVLDVGWSLAIPGILVAAVGSTTIGMGPRERRRFVPLLLLAATGSLGLALGVVVLADPLWSAIAFFGLALALLASTLLGTAGAISALGGGRGLRIGGHRAARLDRRATRGRRGRRSARVSRCSC